MTTLKGDMRAAVRSAAKGWKKVKQREDRVSRETRSYMGSAPYKESARDVAFKMMDRAYKNASEGGQYCVNARQLFYAVRPLVLEHPDVDKLDSRYFTQTLLKDYIEIYRPGWDIVWDARGHLTEPHEYQGTKKRVELGGYEVREYIKTFTDGEIDETPFTVPEQRIETVGPHLRYGGLLFIEKEGFHRQLEEAQIGEQFDVVIMSTKGMPVTAACDLSYEAAAHGCKTYVIHDFDKSGFSIVNTLREGTRGFRGTGDIVDLGFRLEDIDGLQREPVSYGRQRVNPRHNVLESGATQEEAEILVQGREYGGSWHGERVELNAMLPVSAFIGWVERKLLESGVEKVVPDEEVLASAYRRAAFLGAIEGEKEKMRRRIGRRDISVPDDLEDRVREVLEGNPTLSWDDAIWRIALDGEASGS